MKPRIIFVCSGETASKFIEWVNKVPAKVPEEAKVFTDSIQDDEEIDSHLTIGDWFP